MSDALYGLIGALAGSAITAATAYVGPLHLQRRSLAEARQETARARQREEDAREAARLREAEQARTVEQRQYEERRRAERTEAFMRLTRIRSTTREWDALLHRYEQDLTWRRSPSVENFDQEMEQVARDARAAVDEAAHDGVRVPQGPGSPSYHPPGWHEPLEPEVIAATAALAAATSVVREHLLADEAPSPERLTELRQSLAKAENARHALNSFLMDLVERNTLAQPPT
ncbi:hypothetical protein WDA79_08770 [Streptomyces sp. A475]|uniref:hypothetical protein n=1 Tax=Streptomyces sp. A475 TaxID=3131976 RepID=UPI0030C8DA50